MKVNRKELQEALEIVRPGLATKEGNIEQSTSFAFLEGRIITYNDEISISHPVEGLSSLTGAIQAELLYSLLSKITKEEIEIKTDETKIEILSGKLKAKLTLKTEVTLPLTEEIAEKGDWFPIPKNFIKFVKFTMGTCTNDLSRPILTCVHVNNKGFIEAADNFRMARCQLFEAMPINTFLLPASSAAIMTRLNPIKIAEGNGWVHFKTENDTVISCRIFAEEYPNTSKALKVKGISLKLPKSTEELLERASVFAKRERAIDENISITLHNNKFKMKAKTEAGSIEEEANIRYNDKAIRFNVTPSLLRDILSETLECTLGERALKFEGENWVYITILRT